MKVLVLMIMELVVSKNCLLDGSDFIDFEWFFIFFDDVEKIRVLIFELIFCDIL